MGQVLGKGGTQKVTQRTELDPATQRYLQAYRGAAQGQLAQQVNPYQQAFGQQAGQLAQNLGFAQQQGLGGIGAYMNPYEQQVIGGVQSDFDRQRQIAQMMGAQQATQGGAFGGSRGAVLQGQMLGDVGRNEAQTLAGLRYGGFGDAAQRLMADRQMAANLGLAGFQGQGLLGQQMAQNRMASLAGMQGAIGPFQGTVTDEQKMQGNWLSGLLGMGGLAANFIPGIGQLGAALGLGGNIMGGNL